MGFESMPLSSNELPKEEKKEEEKEEIKLENVTEETTQEDNATEKYAERRAEDVAEINKVKADDSEAEKYFKEHEGGYEGHYDALKIEFLSPVQFLTNVKDLWRRTQAEKHFNSSFNENSRGAAELRSKARFCKEALNKIKERVGESDIHLEQAEDIFKDLQKEIGNF